MVNETTKNDTPVAEIPDKLYFKIGEVAKLANLKTHVLRYWETEFPTIRPEKSKSNQRVYKRKDVETIFLIKKLLYEEKYTIEGARTRLKELRYKKKSANTGTSASSEKNQQSKPQQLEMIPSAPKIIKEKADYSKTIETLKSIRGQLSRMLELVKDQDQ